MPHCLDLSSTLQVPTNKPRKFLKFPKVVGSNFSDRFEFIFGFLIKIGPIFFYFWKRAKLRDAKDASRHDRQLWRHSSDKIRTWILRQETIVWSQFEHKILILLGFIFTKTSSLCEWRTRGNFAVHPTSDKVKFSTSDIEHINVIVASVSISKAAALAPKAPLQLWTLLDLH